MRSLFFTAMLVDWISEETRVSCELEINRMFEFFAVSTWPKNLGGARAPPAPKKLRPWQRVQHDSNVLGLWGHTLNANKE